MSGLEEEAMKAVEEKMSKAGLEGNLRIIACSPQKALAESYLANITNSFAQLNFYKYGNVLKENKKNQERLISDFIHRYFEPAYSLVVNSEEAVSLMHLPTSGCLAPHINWLHSRSAPPPLNLPKEGIVLGISNYRGEKQDVRMKVNDRRRHMYIIGKSGTGKSTLMQNMIIQDVANGDGVCVIDPHGDLVEYVLGHLPKNRAEDVILFDPANLERPLGLNMLEFDSAEQKTFVINEMIAIFDKLYDLKATGGPMFEQYMRNAMLLLMEDPASGATLLEVPRVLADESFRAFKLSKCQNPLVKDFWEKEAQKAGGEASLANIVPYITSKLTPFVYSDVMRPIISQSKSSFNFREAMDSKKIILLNLTKGKIGEMSSNLLGMVMIGKLLMGALSRVNVAESERQDFFLYIDEFQNFITDTVGIILSEARKYKLDLIIGHQFIAQLVKNNDTKIRDAVLGNVGTLAAFRLGPEDTEVMAKQFAPVFNERDLLNIPRHNLYLKLLIDGQNAPAFNIQPLPPTPGDPKLAESIKQLSSLKYGRPRAEVEAEVLERIKMTGGSVEDFKLA
ncbi:MAG: type IV secretion system DNA-binding domain-containing protein [Candidatus Komeilibacteria bacterium]|nr:type IV secretion system DNA-binding domain-containing protein [Candidatus Komeilibacteria bacterium]